MFEVCRIHCSDITGSGVRCFPDLVFDVERILHLLEKTGWELVSRPSVEPYWKVVKGQRFWKFRKTIVQ